MIPLLLGGATLAAASYAGIQAFAPRSQLYGPTFIGSPGRGKKLALTFDDGPNPRCTPPLLDVLARHQVKATFFLIGKWVQQRPEIARAIVAAGHDVANHTQTHPNLLFCSGSRLQEELTACERSLADAGVANQHRLFRPPFGARRPQTLATARALGLTPVMWSITCYDWKATTAERVANHAVRQLRGGDVVLLHDGSHSRVDGDRNATVQAVDALISRYKSEGYEFVTISDWLKASDVSGGNQ